MGWWCLPGPSFICPHCYSHSGLHHPLPSSGHGHLDSSTLHSGHFIVKWAGGGWGLLLLTVAVHGCWELEGRHRCRFGLLALINPGDMVVSE